MTKPEHDAALAQAGALLLAPGNLNDGALQGALGQLMKPGVDAADLYFQHSRSESWLFEDGLVKTGSHNVEQGVGVRAVSGEKTGFAYSDELSLPALAAAVRSASAISRQGQDGRLPVLRGAAAPALYASSDPLSSLSTDAKLKLLRRADQAARAEDGRVTQVMVSLAGSHEVILVVAADGTQAADLRPMVRMNVTVIVEANGKREQASSGGGGRQDYLMFADSEQPESLAREAVRQALVRLDADAAPAGTMTVVLGSGWPGVLLHEAVGHGLEGDFNRKGSSAFSGKLGQQVANPQVTVVDDGTLPQRRGSLSIDDEGTPSHCTTLIENGKLVGYMQDKLNARLMKVAATGNGRRESFAHLPMPRMTNTYMLPGAHAPQDIISSVQRGLYAVNFSGGQVDITSGNFVFSTSEAYLIENGKVTRPVKGATLIGNGPQVIQKISMVGNDLALDPGIGVCGKDGQSVPVGVGQPTLKVDGLTAAAPSRRGPGAARGRSIADHRWPVAAPPAALRCGCRYPADAGPGARNPVQLAGAVDFRRALSGPLQRQRSAGPGGLVARCRAGQFRGPAAGCLATDPGQPAVAEGRAWQLQLPPAGRAAIPGAEPHRLRHRFRRPALCRQRAGSVAAESGRPPEPGAPGLRGMGRRIIDSGG